MYLLSRTACAQPVEIHADGTAVATVPRSVAIGEDGAATIRLDSIALAQPRLATEVRPRTIEVRGPLPRDGPAEMWVALPAPFEGADVCATLPARVELDELGTYRVASGEQIVPQHRVRRVDRQDNRRILVALHPTLPVVYTGPWRPDEACPPTWIDAVDCVVRRLDGKDDILRTRIGPVVGVDVQRVRPSRVRMFTENPDRTLSEGLVMANRSQKNVMSLSTRHPQRLQQELDDKFAIKYLGSTLRFHNAQIPPGFVYQVFGSEWIDVKYIEDGINGATLRAPGFLLTLLLVDQFGQLDPIAAANVQATLDAVARHLQSRLQNTLGSSTGYVIPNPNLPASVVAGTNERNFDDYPYIDYRTMLISRAIGDVSGFEPESEQLFLTSLPQGSRFPVRVRDQSTGVIVTGQAGITRLPTPLAAQFNLVGQPVPDFVIFYNSTNTPQPFNLYCWISTRPTCRAEFPSGAGGNTAVYMARLVNTRGETGPWSEVAAATVAA